MIRQLLKLTVLVFFLYSSLVSAQEANTTITSFNKAKKLLHNEVYFDHRFTLYCNATYEMDKSVNQPNGFHTDKHVKRSKRIEWEHVVPAEKFGRAFSEWRDGHAECVSSKGNAFKGRNCASKMNQDYRLMQADMYNLYPAIGAVNAMRSNYNFTMIDGEESDFGSCDMEIDSRKAEPPEIARGRIARTYLYMDARYPRYNMSKQTRQLMSAWNKMYPVSDWECERARRIEKVQGNRNAILSECYK